MVSKGWYNRHPRKENVDLPEDLLSDVHDVFVLWRCRIPPMWRTVAGPDNEVGLGLKLLHRLQGGEDEHFRGVAAVFSSRSSARFGSLINTWVFVAPVENISTLGVEVVKVEIRYVPEVAGY